MKMAPIQIMDTISRVGSAYQERAMTQIDDVSSIRGSRGLGGFSMTVTETHDFIELIYKHSGIVLTPEKKSLISSRLHKRLKMLGLGSFGEYLDYLRGSGEADGEIVAMVDEITTNKTAFFREPHHFNYLTSTVLPALVTSEWSVLNVWSAGCSTGEEPYTLAMVLAEFFGTTRSFHIFATDLSTQALQVARCAVYPDELGTPIPYALRQKYTMSGRGSQSGRFRIVPELRDRVTFRQLNLIDRYWELPEEINIIFCRNVMIYFDKKTRGGIISRFQRHLRGDGHLFIGHSETLGDIEHGLVQVRPTIYSCRK
jgi:chemotaxis protein methyltransferase CheR